MLSLIYTRIDRLRAKLTSHGIEPNNEAISKAWEAEDEKARELEKEAREKERIRANTKRILLEAEPNTKRATEMYYRFLLREQAELVEQLATKKKEILRWSGYAGQFRALS